MDQLPEVQQRRLVIAVDYGTTYTGIATATPAGNRAFLDEIDIILNWGYGMGNHDKIPSVISYSLKTNQNEQQWGTDLSPQAIAMVHTKLQLDVDDTSAELDLILEALDGFHNLDFRYIRDSGGAPKYPRKGPEEIVEDYLKKVFDYLLEAVANFTEQLRTHIPVDIVATIPAGWGYRPKNSLFRALSGAGFNSSNFPQLRQMMLVSEPEAAAIYTARFLKENSGAEFLKKDEHFVLCDAGGGTVDVVSYKVTQLQPTFEIEPVTVPTGDKCGSIFINLAFKKWLRDVLGEARYRELDQSQLNHKIRSHDAEGERMRELIGKFDPYKRNFHRGHRDIRIDLPEPFQDLSLENLRMGITIEGGQIKIRYKDMESFFEPCADGIVGLIQGQIEQIEDLGTRPRNVFLVGGFAESMYLKESIKGSLDMRGISLHVPPTSWTAVVRGAAIFGIEKPSNRSLATMTGCVRSYGVAVNMPFSTVDNNAKDMFKDPLTKAVMAQKQLLWMIKKGDLIISNHREVRRPYTLNFTEAGSGRVGSFPIYSFDGDRLPERLSNSALEVTKVHEVSYDLRGFPPGSFSYVKPVGSSQPFYEASLTLVITMAAQITVTLYLRDQIIYTGAINEPAVPRLDE